eukprot:COSAG01_NODE_16859_length_1198_cov_1.825296_1_plen_206_part_00
MSTPRLIPTTPAKPHASAAAAAPDQPGSPVIEPVCEPLVQATTTTTTCDSAAQAQLDAVTSHCKMTDCVRNPSHTPGTFVDDDYVLSTRQMQTAYSVITQWPGYKPTPLIEMPDVARACGVKSVLYKDESMRFDLQSFKALGGAYAVADLVKAHVAAGHDASTFTAATATDGTSVQFRAPGDTVPCVWLMRLHSSPPPSLLPARA